MCLVQKTRKQDILFSLTGYKKLVPHSVLN
jgi:hypothetical protein